MAKPTQTSGVLGLSGNLDKKVNPNIATSDMWETQGFYLGESLSLSKRKGFSAYNQTDFTDVGIPMVGSPATITGIFEYVPSAGTRHQLACTTRTIFRYNVALQEFEVLDLSNVSGTRIDTADDLYDTATLEDQMYLGNGQDTNIRYDGTHPTAVAAGTQCFNMGIAAPLTTATVAVAGADGSLDPGDYYYKITYANRLGQESNPSASTAVATVAATNHVSLTDIPVSPDAQVTERYIYRTTVDGAVWLYLDTIADNTTTTYTDTYADIELAEEIENFANGVPPVFNKIEIHKGVAFMAGDPSYPSRLWFSTAGFPASVDSNDFRDLDTNDGDTITGMRRFQNTIVVTKNNSIWNMSGDDRYTFALEKRVTSAGSINNASIVEIPTKNIMIMLSNHPRFFMYDGVMAAPTAANIEPILKTLNQDQLYRTVGAVVPSQNQCRWLVPSTGSYSLNLMIWYDYVQDKWGTTDMSSVPANYCATMRNITTSVVEFYVGAKYDAGTDTGGGYVWVGDTGGTDAGANISVSVTDRGHPKEDASPEHNKNFYELTAWFKPTASTTLTVYAYLNSPDSTPINIGTIDASDSSGYGTIRFNQTAQRIYFRFDESSALEGMVLRGWKVVYKDVVR